ncbi:folylpolyglutamate synthetase family protein [Artemisia annua]|uniref:Folylpolyglutamate synthetase family protein n=1 Tax=Artemisia annua TaxID=35608 RepID=A0A2U1PA58_ARTAN|nr:folylpolyglutamate synthetase family protein [Artemisia annua]
MRCLMQSMQSLGNLQSNYKAIEIAGTKGEGSAAAFVSNILRAQGYSIACYTSLEAGLMQGVISVVLAYKKEDVRLDYVSIIKNGLRKCFESSMVGSVYPTAVVNERYW